MYADKYVSKVSDIPKTPHFAILTNNSHYTPGDERSRTHPGHGYSASTDYYVSYEVYLTREKWEAAIVEKTEDKFGASPPFIAVEVKPATITTQVKVS